MKSKDVKQGLQNNAYSVPNDEFYSNAFDKNYYGEEDFSDEEDTSLVKKAKKKKKKSSIYEKIFCLVSILFIVGCCIFYGARLIKYYKIYNPKVVNIDNLLALEIVKKSPMVYEGEGLYRLNGNYVYRGKNVNNYLIYSNLLWRIVQINADHSIDLVLDEPINFLSFGSSATNFKDSNVSLYLNEQFLPFLNPELIEKSAVCLDERKEIEAEACKNLDTNFSVRILSLNQFLNSIESSENTTFINNNPSIWLSDYGEDFVWHTNENHVSHSASDAMYALKPVITLKSTTQLVEGEGTKEQPYKVEKEKTVTIGSHIKLGEDVWTVYETNDSILKLVSTNLLPATYSYSLTSSVFDPSEEGSLAHYLNTIYYEELPYKNLLLNTTWNIGNYQADYQEVKNKTVEARVGLYSVADLKFETNLNGYTLLTPFSENEVYKMEEDTIGSSSIQFIRNVRPTISIAKKSIQSGSGSIQDPYILEVEA